MVFVSVDQSILHDWRSIIIVSKFLCTFSYFNSLKPEGFLFKLKFSLRVHIDLA